jgi:hypothetical protein
MRIVCALDVHRRQITYAIVDCRSGEMSRGRITPATRESVREWLARFEDVDEVRFALEGTTGWRFVVEEVERAGHRAHLADLGETAARRGRKRRAKTNRADCDVLLRLLAAGELPEYLTRPRVLPAGGAADRPQPRLPVGRAQTPPTRLPHPARARRRGARPGRARTDSRGGDRRRSLTSTPPRAPARRHDDGLRSAPEQSLPPAYPAGRPLKTEPTTGKAPSYVIS